MEFLLIVFLTLLNALFAMSEMALATSRKVRLTALAESGDKGAQVSLALMENPTQFLSTIQVGITSIGVLNGIVGESAFSGPVAQWLLDLNVGLHASAANVLATVLVVTAITFVTIIFGELVPKRIGQMYPELIARWMARPMNALALIAKPFVKLLTLSTQAVLKLMGLDKNTDRSVTEEEITASLAEGVDAGLIEHHEHQMVRNVFHLDDRALTSIMVPRSDIQWLDSTLTVKQALEKLTAESWGSGHSWYPVCKGGMDHVLGIISLAQLVRMGVEDEESIEVHVQPASFVPETLTGLELLDQLRDRSGRILFVVDEYGDVQGLVTPRDLLEAITGELEPGHTMDTWAKPLQHGAWELDGAMPINEFKARLGIKQVPHQDKGRYNTLAGLWMALTGELPKVGDSVEIDGWSLAITEMVGRRIEKIHAAPVSSSLING